MTSRAAVLGSPVVHSLSPALHRAGYAARGWSDWSYDRIDCDAARLPGLIAASGPDWLGFSVTMPGKAAAAAAAARRSERVQLLGVANTLWRRRSDSVLAHGRHDGRHGDDRSADGGFADGGDWSADNTDVDGVIGALRAAGVGRPRRALVLGGGHTARAVLAALADLGASEVVLCGRRPASTTDAAALAGRLGLTATQLDLSPAAVAAAAAGVDLAAATLPAGAADPLAPALARVPVLLDAVYHPWPTPVAAAGRPGRVTVTGLDMLLHQALRQFQLITGHPAPAAAMRAGLLAASGSALPLPL